MALGDWKTSGSGDAAHLRQSGAGDALLLSRSAAPSEVRAEADVRLAGGNAAGLVVGHRDPAHQVRVTIDRTAAALVVEVVDGTRRETRRAPLPAGFRYDAWHSLAIDVHNGVLSAEVSDARLSGPVATVSVQLPYDAGAGQVGVTARGGADVDNVSATRRHVPVTRAVPVPAPGEQMRAYSAEFTDPIGTGWTWIRPDAAANVNGGALNWPTQAADLVGSGNQAGVLLRDLPADVARSSYIVETKVTLDLGVDTIRNYQQAGLIAYAGDDDFARLCTVAIWSTRQVEYGRELKFADRLSFGGSMLGPPGTTTWLRLAHRVDPANGEHEFPAASSSDGRTWTWGGVWTFPAGADVRIGLVSQGGSNPPVTAQFDYVRMYRW